MLLVSRSICIEMARAASWQLGRATECRGNGRPKVGDEFKNPALAHSLREVAAHGRDAFYNGPITEIMVKFLQAQRGTHTLEDFKDFQPEWVEPVSTTYRGWTVYELPPNGQGIAAAYDAYLRGRLYFVNEFTKPDSLKKAQHYFEESLQKDPDFALAYAGRADTYVYLAFAGALPRDQAYRFAKQSPAKALELDDSIGEAHDTLGELSWDFDWDRDTADREFNRAIALAPSYSCAHEDRAIFLAATGRRAEALAEIAKIDQLDYSFSAAHSESKAYFDLRDYPRLIDASKRALLLDPNDWSQHYNLGVGYEGTGKLQEAISGYQKAMEMSGGSPGPAVALAHAYAAVGRKAEAAKILHDLQRKLKGTPASPYTMATIYAALGENDRAFEFLDKAYSEKSLGIPSSLKSDFLLDSLRPDPRFQDPLQRIGLTG
jgi:tetratricopeptide (TPR) repeat protein